MLIETIYTPWRKARAVNQTSTSGITIATTLVEPSGDAGTATGHSVLEIGRPASFTQNALLLQPYGVGSDTNTFSVDVWGWRPVAPCLNDGTGRFTWVPTLLCELACTLTSGATGVAGGAVLDTEYFCDTLTVTYGNANVSVEIVSNANNLPAHAVVTAKGFQKFELSFFTGSSATSCNALVAFQ